MSKTALITGCSGQDGSYLAELLLSKGYEVHGIVRRSSTSNTSRIDHIKSKLHLHYGDLADNEPTSSLIREYKFDEIYNMAAQSHVGVSFENPDYTADITALGAARILEAIKVSSLKSKFLQASSSEMFGSAKPPQNEQTPFDPQSPYAVSKLFSFHTTKYLGSIL
jgi:GDPmannose 4,6-dehydratase